MGEAIMTRRDRTIGIVLLIVGVVISVMPNFQLAGWPIKPNHVGSPWIGSAMLLLLMDYSARPMPRLTRWIAAILFAMGLAAPFIVYFIDSSLGA